MKTSFPIRNLLVGPLILSVIITGVIYFNGGSWKLILLSVIYIEIGFSLFLYLIDFQFSVKIFEATQTAFIIHYPVSFLLKKKIYNLNNIEKLKFDYPQGAKRLPLLFVYLKNGKKAKRYSFFVDKESLEALIEYLRNKDVEVEYIPGW